jgi:ABC-type lipoprotein export system ATPase subunit
MTQMLETKSLEFAYDSGMKFKFPDIFCDKNSPLLILGNSGSGKTTFLNILALLKTPYQGEVLFSGKNALLLNENEIPAFRAKKIGMIFQKPYFVNSLNVLDNLTLANYLAKAKIDKPKAIKLADTLGIGELLNKKVTELSGGEQQRVCIARALMNSPSVILADEPTSALDDTNCEKVISLLEEQAKEANAALIIVTHDQRLKNRIPNQILL